MSVKYRYLPSGKTTLIKTPDEVDDSRKQIQERMIEQLDRSSIWERVTDDTPAEETRVAAPVEVPAVASTRASQIDVEPTSREVREWARRHGHEVSDNGRPRKALFDAYKRYLSTDVE